MKVNFIYPKRGANDSKPTPEQLYKIIMSLGFKDVCSDPSKFDAAKQVWPDRSYCNPPFSNKKPFIQMALKSHSKGSEVLLYLPFDPTYSGFHMLYFANARILVFTKRIGYARYPHALYHLKDYSKPEIILIWSLEDVKNYIF